MAEVTITERGDERTVVRLRIAMADSAAAASALGLPAEPLTSRAGDPAALWIAPDQWLIASSSLTAETLIERIDGALGGRLYHATDASDALTCYVLEGPAARSLLAMGSGVDFDASAFPIGRCVRTRYARMAVVIHAVDDDCFDVYLDRSGAHSLEQWLRRAALDATA